VWGVWADVSAALASFDGKARAPRADSIVESLAPLLKEVEAHGFTDAFADHEIWPRIAKILHFHSHCSVMPPGLYAPGIWFLGHGHGHSRTTYIEYDVVRFLQAWLDSKFATNARKSLAGQPGTRVLALAASMDGPAIAMIRTLQENPGEALRTPLNLPEEIDTLVVTTGDEVLHFHPDTGWARHTTESLSL
jgi:hypothetical protein